ncbi:MAG: ATP-binding cassette domain-containing protein [Chloroflexi bacterium]|nr:ATP-binding cassette domain-containing protein [Chloroflexota bacterium]
MGNGTAVLAADRLTKVFGSGEAAVRAVDDVSLAVLRGELVLISGPSGSGKTTLLSMLGGLLRPTSGRVVIDGTDITALGESHLPNIRARRIGFIFQAFNLISSLTAEENVMFPASLAPARPVGARPRARALLEKFGLGRRARHLPRDLSGGEKQRVAIARALINDPELILADEPTGNLDSKSGYDVMMRLYDLAKDERRTVVIVTHNPVLQRLADRVLWLEDGRIRERKDEDREWLVDPVCGMRVDQWAVPYSTVAGGVRYAFCSKRCLDRFSERPNEYGVRLSTAEVTR